MNEGFNYESIRAGYYDEVFHLRKGVQSAWHHLKFRFVRERLPPSGRLLDIGCGPGTFLGTLPEAYEAVGVDLAPAQITYAERRYGRPGRSFQACEPGPLPFADASFDIITLIEVIEHLDTTASAAVLADAYRLLRPGGVLVVTTPNYASLWPLLEWMVNKVGEVSYEDQHITRLRPDTLATLITQAGFAGATIEAFHWLSPFAAALGWGAAETAYVAEPDWLRQRLGNLLFAAAVKAG